MALTVVRSALFTVVFYLWSATVAILAIPTSSSRAVVMRVMADEVERRRDPLFDADLRRARRDPRPSVHAFGSSPDRRQAPVHVRCLRRVRRPSRCPLRHQGWRLMKRSDVRLVLPEDGHDHRRSGRGDGGAEKASCAMVAIAFGQGRQLLIFPKAPGSRRAQAGDYKLGVAASRSRPWRALPRRWR